MGLDGVDGGRVPAVWGLELYRLESNLHVVAVRTGVGIAAGSTRVTLVAIWLCGFGIRSKQECYYLGWGITNPPVLIGRTFFYGGFQIRRDA